MGKKRVIQKTGGSNEGVSKTREVSAAKKIREGKIYVYSSYNNTIMSLTDLQGNVLSNVSAGAIGFKGARKATPFAASKVADTLSVNAKNRGIEKITVYIKGIGSGRESALRALGTKEFEIISIKDVTPVPHNGPRGRKPRRV